MSPSRVSSNCPTPHRPAGPDREAPAGHGGRVGAREGASAYLWDPANVALLDALEEVAAERGVGVSAVALAWLRQQSTVAALIVSARTADQLVGLVESFDLVLSEEELARLG